MLGIKILHLRRGQCSLLLQGRNQFTGSLPALSGLAECTELSLDNNQLTQTIPADWWQMPALQVLDLAFNNLR